MEQKLVWMDMSESIFEKVLWDIYVFMAKIQIDSF